MDKILVAIGGGELKSKETLDIDGYIGEIAKKRVIGRRINALFVGTASHDSMPYYNTFHKTYTGELGFKTDCVLSVYGEMDDEKIRYKFEKADVIYVGGGDTVYMLNKWKEKGIDELVLSAYERGAVLCGLSAGAICWFESMFTDSEIAGKTGVYAFADALGLIKGCACPHYDERKGDLFADEKTPQHLPMYAIENNSAVVFINGEAVGSVGKASAYYLENNSGKIKETLLKRL